MSGSTQGAQPRFREGDYVSWVGHVNGDVTLYGQIAVSHGSGVYLVRSTDHVGVRLYALHDSQLSPATETELLWFVLEMGV